jgi:hypothetical protein
MNKKILSVFFSTYTFFALAGIAHADEELTPIPKISSEWRFEITPYLWTPGISSTLFFKDRYLNTANMSSSNVLGDLKSGGMISAEAHYGSWGIMGDLVSATLQTTTTTGVMVPTRIGAIPVGLSNTSTLQQNILTGAATYTVFNNPNAYVDGLIGARAIAATATVGLVLSVGAQSITASDSKSVSTIDPRYRIADSTWYLPFYADVGGGGGKTNVTWQAALGIGKTFAKWVDVSLTYRELYYDMTGDNLLQKTTFKGPQLSATFNF